MPVKNYFPQFYKLKPGAYSYIWTDKCERLLPKHYKARCLEYMMKEPTPVHYIPDNRKYTFDKHGTRIPVQNHPIHIRYPDQCNYGLWAGEGLVFCYIKKLKGETRDRYKFKFPKVYAPMLVTRSLYSEILDKWFTLPCTNRAMDLIDQAYGLDNYILKTHERDINSKIGMDIKRTILVALAKGDVYPDDADKKAKILKKYKDFIMPVEEAEWVGLSIKEALEKVEKAKREQRTPLKKLIEQKFLEDIKAQSPQVKEEGSASKEDTKSLPNQEQEKVKQEGTAV